MPAAPVAKRGGPNTLLATVRDRITSIFIKNLGRGGSPILVKKKTISPTLAIFETGLATIHRELAVISPKAMRGIVISM